MENFVWHEPKKDATEDNKRKVTIERCKALFDNLEDYREEAFRYFISVDYKYYNPKENSNFYKDDNDDENLLENPYLTLNVTNSCIETITNKIAKIKPKVTFLTKDADREKREQARKLDNWSLKILKKGRAYKEASKAFKSACVTGLGVVKLIPDEYKKIKFEKVPIFQFFCDNAQKGKSLPTEAGECKTFTLYELIEMFPTKEAELKENHGERLDENIKVFEIFKDYKKHVILTEKVTLKEEKWDCSVPYQLFKFEEADQGVFSVGVCKKLYQIQQAITYILGKTFMSIKNFAVPRVFVNQGADPTPKDISNIVGEIIEINNPEGRPPVFSTPQAISDQVVQILNLLWQRAFEVIGVSQLSAGGQIPRGLEKASGTALRTYQQTESERFQLIRNDYEESFIGMIKKAIKMLPDSDLPISRKEIMEAKDKMSIWTSSLLPETPAGKLAMVGDLFNSGLLKTDQALSLMESPDTSKFLSSETARTKAVDLLLDRALEKGKKPVYYPALGLDLFVDRARKLFAEIIVEEEDSPKLLILGECIKELERKVTKQTGIANAISQITGGSPPPQGQGIEPLQPVGGLINE